MTAHIKEDNELSLSTLADGSAKVGAHTMSALKSATSETLLAAVLKSLDEDKRWDSTSKMVSQSSLIYFSQL